MGVVFDILHKQGLYAGGAAATAVWQLLHDVDDGSEDLTVPVGDEGRSGNVVHLGDLIVQLDEVCGGLLASERSKAVFYYRALS